MTPRCPECGSDDIEVTPESAPYANCLTCGAEFDPTRTPEEGTR